MTSLEVAGVGLGAAALVPPTLSLINFWTRFIEDTRRFGEDSTKLALKFSQLSAEYESLQRVLFDANKFAFLLETTVYDTLTDRFQGLILAMLKELPRVLYEYYVIEKAYEVENQHEKVKDDLHNQDMTIAVVLKPEEMKAIFDGGDRPEARAKSSLLSIHHIWWAARTKKRVQKLLSDYEDWLRRIKSTLEQSWWPLTFLEKYENAEVVEKDQDCQKLGLAATAGLRKLLLHDAPMSAVVPLVSTKIEIQPFDSDSSRGYVQLSNETVYIESLVYQPTKEGFLDSIMERRFKEICSVLNRVKDPEFQVLHCRNYAQSLYPETQFHLIFDIPSNCKGNPISLKSLINSNDLRQSLNSRIRLCHHLARSLSLFHSIGWIHKSLRSENILFFHMIKGKALDQPYICGFEACRVEEDMSTGLWDDLPTRNVYRHPDRWGMPKKNFTKYHDIYALGVILLEIGLWQVVSTIKGIDLEATIKNSEEGAAPKIIYERLLRQSNGRLGPKCGDRFQRIVSACLQGKSGDLGRGTPECDGTQIDLQQKFHEVVVEPLKTIADALSMTIA